MKAQTRLLPVFMVLFIPATITAQVPPMIRYQSTIAIGGTNYHGVAYMKFALINREATQTYWSNDGTSEGAGEPLHGLDVDVNHGLYEVFLGDTSLTNMVPLLPTVFTNNGVHIRVWFSTGSGPYQVVEPDQPIPAVGYAMMSANVADGAITAAKLVPGVVTADKLAPQAVTTANLAPGSVGSAQLAPNSTAENLNSSGGLVLSKDPEAIELTAAGFTKIGTVAAGMERWSSNSAFCPAARAMHLAAWTGSEMIVWGGTTNYYGLAIGGGIYHPVTQVWTPISLSNAPPMTGPTNYGTGAAWTGDEMIVFSFGGQNGYGYNPITDRWRRLSKTNAPTQLVGATLTWTGKELLVFGNVGARHSYNPSADTWTLMSSSNAPSIRQNHTAVWTGSEMIIWGGTQGATASTKLRNGAQYNPVTDSWKVVALSNAPSMRSGHSAVWTGSEMIIWGGNVVQGASSANERAGGAIYNPEASTWRPMTTNGAPMIRQGHYAYWTGSRMVVGGGYANNYSTSLTTQPVYTDGALYDPKTDQWTSIALPPCDSTWGYSSVWTGSELIIWGGALSSLVPTLITRTVPLLNQGMIYNSKTDQWRPMAFSPEGRSGHSAVWTGRELIIWGGNKQFPPESYQGTGFVNTGGRYDPVTARWYPLSTRNAPYPRQNHQAVWTGTEMIVWGGEGKTNMASTSKLVGYPVTGGRYNPATDQWTPMNTNSAPVGRAYFTMVWSGQEAIIFGGQSSTYPTLYPTVFLYNGALYDPEKDRWSSMDNANAPVPRCLHTAVWTGQEMVIWGGMTSNRNVLSPANDGGRYNPALNRWTSISTLGAPRAYTNQVAIWTGKEVLICGSPNALLQNGRYDPASDRWETMATLLGGLTYKTQIAAWTGKEVLVWGETGGSRGGGRYHPSKNTWEAITKTGAPPTYSRIQGVWTGDELLLFGGYQASRGLLPDTLFRYTLETPLYLYGKP